MSNKIRSFNSRPDGKNDRQGRWYPDPEREECECCKNVRQPSRAWPSSLWKHCNSKSHYLNLCKKLNAEPIDLPERPKRKPVEEMIGYKAVFVRPNGKFISIFRVTNDRNEYEWVPKKWRKEAIDNDALFAGENPTSGLWFFGDLAEALIFARKNLKCVDNFAVFECRCRFFQKYPSGAYNSKYICSMLRMERAVYSGRVESIYNKILSDFAEKIKKELNING